MKKNLVFGLCLVTALTASNVQAATSTDWANVLKDVSAINASKDGTTSTADVATIKKQITNINKELSTANSSVQTSFNKLVTALSTKQDAATIKSKVNSINTNKKLTEAQKSQMIAEIITDYSGFLQKNKTSVTNSLKNASAAKKAEINNAITSLKNIPAKYSDITKDCKNVTTAISKNPSLSLSCASELMTLNNTIKSVSNNTKAIQKVTTQAVSIAKSAGITVK